jgi:hypothetical protein
MTEQDDHQARQGYLLLADISGYTAFLTGTELEQAHAIVRELTKHGGHPNGRSFPWHNRCS